jgi:aryl-alcohol dehydrogenase-like predicted oxidoreductase
MTWGNQNTESQAHEQMDYALSQGVNFFDTAELYAVPPAKETQGKTEEIIGTWLKKTGNRDKIILATKITGPGFPWIREGTGISKNAIFEAVEGNLKRLQTDYIDLYQLHWPNWLTYNFGRHDTTYSSPNRQRKLDMILENLQALDELVKQGKIRHIGLSDDTAWGCMSYLHLADKYNLPRIASIQNEYSLLWRFHDKDLHEISVVEKVGLLAWSPLACGAISGKYLNAQMPQNTRRTLLNGGTHRDNPFCDKAIEAYIKIAQKHGLDVCQMALAFVNGRPFTTSTIIGATTMEQLKTNIDSINLTLSKEVLKDIDEAARYNPQPY